jgi:hypothetical protein
MWASPPPNPIDRHRPISVAVHALFSVGTSSLMFALRLRRCANLSTWSSGLRRASACGANSSASTARRLPKPASLKLARAALYPQPSPISATDPFQKIAADSRNPWLFLTRCGHRDLAKAVIAIGGSGRSRVLRFLSWDLNYFLSKT